MQVSGFPARIKTIGNASGDPVGTEIAAGFGKVVPVLADENQRFSRFFRVFAVGFLIRVEIHEIGFPIHAVGFVPAVVGIAFIGNPRVRVFAQGNLRRCPRISIGNMVGFVQHNLISQDAGMVPVPPHHLPDMVVDPGSERLGLAGGIPLPAGGGFQDEDSQFVAGPEKFLRHGVMGRSDYVKSRLFEEQRVPALHGIRRSRSHKGIILMSVDAAEQRGAFAVEQQPFGAVCGNAPDAHRGFQPVQSLFPQNEGGFQTVKIGGI